MRPDLGHEDVAAPIAAVQVALCALAVLCSSVVYVDFFDATSYLWWSVLAAVVAAALGCRAGRRRWSLIWVALCGCAGFVLLTVAALYDTWRSGLPTIATAIELYWGVVGGWARMLSVGLPTQPRGEVIVMPLLLAWFGAYLASIAAVRIRFPLTPVMPLAVPLLFGLVMVASTPEPHLAIAAGFLAVVLVLITIRTWRLVRSPTIGRLWAGAKVVVVVLSVTVLVGFTGLLGSGENRVDPRPLEPASLANRDILSPLASVKVQLEEHPARRLFSVRLAPDPGAPAVDRIRIVTLEQFDGAQWSSRDKYVAVSARMRPEADLVGARQVSVRVTFEDYVSQYLPEIGWPVRVSVQNRQPTWVGFSPTSGSLIADLPVGPGFAYTMVGTYRTAQELPQTATASASGPVADLAHLTPDVPPQILVRCHQLANGEDRPIGKLAAIEGYLRGLPYNVQAPPGGSYDAVSKLIDPAYGVGGYEEQHAAAFAVMARILGYPTRLVVGYRLTGGSGLIEVTSGDASIWPEVHFDGYGWIAFDPTDRSQVVLPSTPPPSPTPSLTNTPTNPPPTTAPSPSAGPGGTTRHRPWSIAGGLVAFGIGVGGMLALAECAVLLAKVRRRRRRRTTGGPPVRLVGAWDEALDRLIERRMTIAPSWTPLEIATYAQANPAFGWRVSALADLAEPATMAVFSPGDVGEAEVSRAWGLERALRRQMYAGWARWRRLGALLSPRPLIDGRVRKPGGRWRGAWARLRRRVATGRQSRSG